MNSYKRISLFILSLHSCILFSQNIENKYITRSGYIDFFSSTPIEDIKAENKTVGSILNSKNGDFVFEVMMKSFKFKNFLMEQHFNEKYVESDEFPTATFHGKINDFKYSYLKESIELPVSVSGFLSIHGVEKEITTNGTLRLKGNQIIATSSFILKPEDFQIKIPAIVRNNIAKEVQIKVYVELSPM